MTEPHDLPFTPLHMAERTPAVRAQLSAYEQGRGPILIVGAGPIGMTAALALATFGIRSILFDDDDKLSDGSRAIAIHRSALEVFERLGCVAPMLERGLSWQVRRTYFRDTELFSQRMPPPTPGVLPTFLNLQQYETEQFLLDRIAATGLVDVRWLHRVVGVAQDAAGVRLEVATPQGTQHIHGAYVLACDGARSAMRKLLQLPFPGTTHPDRFLIADIRADLPFAHEPRFFFDPACNPGRTLLIHPQPNNVWRIDWQLPSNVDIAAEYDPERLDRRIRAVIGDLPYELVWLSDYRFHQRLLDRFRHGRIFFLGDAAHLMAPFGARGMNSGIHDVDNLAWKLWLVLAGRAPDGLLDTYDAERWAAQQQNQRVTTATMRFLVPPSKLRLVVRNMILRASQHVKPLRRLVNSGKMVQPFTYGRSPIVAPDGLPPLLRWWRWRRAPALGAKAPDGPCIVVEPAGHRPTNLRKLFGAGLVALYFAPHAASARAFAAEAGATAPAVPTTLYIVVPEATDLQPPILQQRVRLLLDTQSVLAKAYDAQPGSLYLIRPDGHLAARRRMVRQGELDRLVHVACGIQEPSPAPGRAWTPGQPIAELIEAQ